jgi:hypothetical protein
MEQTKYEINVTQLIWLYMDSISVDVLCFVQSVVKY